MSNDLIMLDGLGIASAWLSLGRSLATGERHRLALDGTH